MSDPSEDNVRRGIASGAARVVLPAGRIHLSQTLQVPAGMTLIGAGADRTHFTASASIGQGQAMIEGAGRGIVMADFSLDGRAEDGEAPATGFSYRASGTDSPA